MSSTMFRSTRFVAIYLLFGGMSLAPAMSRETSPSRPATNAVADRVKDAYVPVWTEIIPASYLGQRMLVNQEQRLKKIDVDKQLIAPYIKKTGSWSGECLSRL